MTIEEIKEWREDNLKFDRGIDTADVKFEIIDTLLAEVVRLEKHNAYADQYNAVQGLHLTIATEALERIHNCQEYHPCGCGLAATNALERIEG